MSQYTIDPAARIGHVHLKVADLERATCFYRDVLGFTVTLDGRPMGIQAVFLAAGDYHHHIALNTFQSAGGSPPAAEQTGLFHFAILYPDRETVGVALRRVIEGGHTIDSAIDHGGTVALYLRDPDGNGIELSYDRPRSEWFDEAGRPIVKAERFDYRDLLEDAHTALNGCLVT